MARSVPRSVTPIVGRMAGARAAAVGAIKATAALADRVRRPPPGVVILIYHRVGAPHRHRAVDLPAACSTSRWRGSPAGRARSTPRRRRSSRSPRRRRRTGSTAEPVVVTFDDGTADLAEHALPILVRHGVPATFYLATDFVERAAAVPPRRRADVVGGGSATRRDRAGHRRLAHRTPTPCSTGSTPPAAADELDRSRALIEERLGVTAVALRLSEGGRGRPAPVEALGARAVPLGGARRQPTQPATAAPTAIAWPARRSRCSDGMRWFERKAARRDGIRGSAAARPQPAALLRRGVVTAAARPPSRTSGGLAIGVEHDARRRGPRRRRPGPLGPGGAHRRAGIPRPRRGGGSRPPAPAAIAHRHQQPGHVRRRRPGGSRGCRWRPPAARSPPPPSRREGSPRDATAARTRPCRGRAASTSSRRPRNRTPPSAASASWAGERPSALSGSSGPMTTTR